MKQIAGRQVLLALGQSTAAQTVLRADRLGHFSVQAYVNGHPLTGLIDTGGSIVGAAEALGELADVVSRGVDPPTDHVASAEYRRHALGVLARRLLERAIGERAIGERG